MSPTKIQWADETWNPIRARRRDGTGKVGWVCVRVSPGCVNCYAATQNEAGWAGGTRLDYTVPNLAKVEVFLDEKTLEEPLHWRKMRRVFVCSMTDLFGDWVPDGFIARIWMRMLQSPHDFLVLTKRPDRMRDFVTRWNDLTGDHEVDPIRGGNDRRGPNATRMVYRSGRARLFADALEAMGTPPPGAAYPTYDWMEGPRFWPTYPSHNVWLGTSVEDQQRADERIPHLLATPAAVRFLSCEPLLGPVDLRRPKVPALDTAELDWVIVGGESGSRARAMDLAWARSLVEQCRAAGIAFFCKQLGAKPVGEWGPNPPTYHLTDITVSPARESIELNRQKNGVWRLADKKGGSMSEWPGDLRVREWPR